MITVLIILGAVLVFVLLWLLFAPLSIEADSRIPYMGVRWAGIGRAVILYDGEWKISWRLFWWNKSTTLLSLLEKQTTKKLTQTKRATKKKRRSLVSMWRKVRRVAGTFRVHEWQWALDTGDHTVNARLYPVNFLPGLYKHLQVNFNGINYCSFRISNQAWRVLYALIRKR